MTPSIIIPLIFAGLALLFGQYLTYLKSKEIVNVNTQQTSKLNRIEILVDGRYSEVLQELADVKRLLAAESGKSIDIQKAKDAQVTADQQAVRVTNANLGQGDNK